MIKRFVKSKALLWSTLLIGLVVSLGCSGSTSPAERAPDLAVAPADTGFRLEGVGFETPESVLHDSQADLYLISNINGGPAAADGDGFVSRVKPDGTGLELRWIDGASEAVVLNAPKGLAIVGEELFVADIDTVRVFDRSSGTPLRSLAIEGAKFLNDVVPDAKGGLFVSDSMTQSVHRISAEGVVTTVLSDEALASPNGLAMLGEDLLVASFRSTTLFRISATREAEHEASLPEPGLDGLVVLDDGTILVSSWTGRAIYSIDAEGSMDTQEENLRAPADIGFDRIRQRLLIPLFHDNVVLVRPL